MTFPYTGRAFRGHDTSHNRPVTSRREILQAGGGGPGQHALLQGPGREEAVQVQAVRGHLPRVLLGLLRRQRAGGCPSTPKPSLGGD